MSGFEIEDIKAVAKGMIHKNAAARKKSRFAARLNKMGA